MGTVNIEGRVAKLDNAAVRALLVDAAERHPDVARAVTVAAGRDDTSLDELRREIDGLRTRRFVSYRESTGWARDADPIVAELARLVDSSPSADVVALIERAAENVVKVLLHADDSNGSMGDVARALLAVHANACDAGVADPVKLARWMRAF